MISSNCEVSIRIISHFVTAPFRDVSNVTSVLSVASRRDVSNITYIFHGIQENQQEFEKKCEPLQATKILSHLYLKATKFFEPTRSHVTWYFEGSKLASKSQTKAGKDAFSRSMKNTTKK